ncbi:DNA polymerase Y family protein [Methylonatrum kenyense]|uniref:Y-family DNA polymerase n=1 Tax=Methylonatrum kenyense TaxID=455253 RepID=UPI0020BF8EA8|nr:DNA polymerase Y family protein [Methylonatrum kenyense]MCK8515892.1 DNA polymerase Y family protein [Methylonatrum kenyense]
MALLWQALRFPELPLDVFRRGCADEPLMAVIDGQRLLAVSRTAAAEGVCPGMRPAQARSLCPELQLVQRKPHLEQDSLRRLADGLLQFSGWVSRQPPLELVLEIGGSLRLFGGMTGLQQQLNAHLQQLGLHWQTAVAPTAAAAGLFCRAGGGTLLTQRAALAEQLAALPIQVLELTPEQTRALSGLGLQTLGDCLRLPSAELGRRLGGTLSEQLQRALGERPDPRPSHRPRPVFHGELALPAAAHDSTAVLFALQRLLQDLRALLISLQAGVQRVHLQLQHEDHAATLLLLGLQDPSRDVERLLAVANERLQRTPLKAPVTGLILEARHLLPLAARPADLLQQGQAARMSWQQLTERLGARLGDTAISGLGTAPDHRPERAWHMPAPAGDRQQTASPHRPLWLLPEPKPLACRDGLPEHRGRLQLCQGPERIEGGWWDGQDISRDYYQAQAADGSRLWVFRDRRHPGRWFLHGYFG